MNESSKENKGRRYFGRTLISLAVFTTLIAFFYTEEDWRGKRAWEDCKRDLEAKGVVLDWDKYIPQPVPDDQNFYMAGTQIRYRFKKFQTDAEYKASKESQWLRITYPSNSFPNLDTNKFKPKPLVVAEFIITPAAGATAKSLNADLTVSLNDPAARQDVQDSVEANMGRSINGAAGFQFSERQLSSLKPVQIRLLTDSQPGITDLENLLPSDTITNVGQLQVAATIDKTIFQVQWTGLHIMPAADFLKWSDQYVPALDEVRKALKRPYALLPGDYSRSYDVPVPNFVMLRSVAQLLAQRAQCYFLLNEPDKALHETTLMLDVCRILEKLPTGKPMTLLEAMIHVAIIGLYVNTIADGFHLHVWQEPQLAALQAQLQPVNLVPSVHEAFQTEPAAVCRDLEILSPSELFSVFSVGAPKNNRSTRLSLWLLLPRGWIYQNMVNIAVPFQKLFAGIDLANNIVTPRLVDASNLEVSKFLEHKTPYRFLAAAATPNFAKAVQTLAYNQTLANEAQIACALERYHLAHNEYPETLDILMPQFIEKIPQDIIGGGPLHYRRTDAGKFILYSVGWNEKDDGGQVALTKTGLINQKKGDWVWKN